MRRLLLADDSPTIQRVVELTFADEDVAVETVANGADAISRIDAEPPDIILADVDMPGASGYDITRHIKQSANLPPIPIVLLTGAFERREHARALESGCDAVLAKPFEPAVVIATVRDLLDRRAAPPEPMVAKETARLTLAPSETTADYFDRLDAAFADLSCRTPAAVVAAVPAPAPAVPASVPVAVPSPPQHADAPALPGLADAFAALLDAERREYGLEPVAWPATPAPAIDIDALVEQVVNRALARLTDGAIHETIADLVRNEVERIRREE